MSALHDKVVIVTDGSSGIGRAAALSLARQGAKVIITARRAAPLDETAADHPSIVGLVADAAAPDDAVRTIAKAVDTCRPVDRVARRSGFRMGDGTGDRRRWRPGTCISDWLEGRNARRRALAR